MEEGELYFPIWERIEKRSILSNRRTGSVQRLKAVWFVQMAETKPLGPITIERLEKYLDWLAHEIDLRGEEGAVFFPLWERLEQELSTLQKNHDTMARVRARLKKLP
jgi:hypothetical protein